MKTSENLGFSDVFRGYRIGILVENGLIFKKAFPNTLFYLKQLEEEGKLSTFRLQLSTETLMNLFADF